jgi:hypothetical protein
MEYDCSTDEQDKNNSQSKSSVDVPGDCDISESARLRRRLLLRNAMDRVLLDYNCHLLPWIGILLWAIFLATQKG